MLSLDVILECDSCGRASVVPFGASPSLVVPYDAIMDSLGYRLMHDGLSSESRLLCGNCVASAERLRMDGRDVRD